MSQIVAIPEATVEDLAEVLVPLFHTCLIERTSEVAVYGLSVGTHDGINVLGATSTPLDLEYPHARVQHLVEEVDGLEVLGRHDVFVVYCQLDTGLLVPHLVGATTDLGAGASVGTLAVLV